MLPRTYVRRTTREVRDEQGWHTEEVIETLEYRPRRRSSVSQLAMPNASDNAQSATSVDSAPGLGIQTPPDHTVSPTPQGRPSLQPGHQSSPGPNRLGQHPPLRRASESSTGQVTTNQQLASQPRHRSFLGTTRTVRFEPHPHEEPNRTRSFHGRLGSNEEPHVRMHVHEETPLDGAKTPSDGTKTPRVSSHEDKIYRHSNSMRNQGPPVQDPPQSEHRRRSSSHRQHPGAPPSSYRSVAQAPASPTTETQARRLSWNYGDMERSASPEQVYIGQSSSRTSNHRRHSESSTSASATAQKPEGFFKGLARQMKTAMVNEISKDVKDFFEKEKREADERLNLWHHRGVHETLGALFSSEIHRDERDARSDRDSESDSSPTRPG